MDNGYKAFNTSAINGNRTINAAGILSSSFSTNALPPSISVFSQMRFRRSSVKRRASQSGRSSRSADLTSQSPSTSISSPSSSSLPTPRHGASAAVDRPAPPLTVSWVYGLLLFFLIRQVQPRPQMPEYGSFCFFVEIGPASAQINKNRPPDCTTLKPVRIACESSHPCLKPV